MDRRQFFRTAGGAAVGAVATAVFGFPALGTAPSRANKILAFDSRGHITLMDLARRNGDVRDRIIQQLCQTNEILSDMKWKEA